MEKKTKEKVNKIELKLRKRHPRKEFRLGRHKIGINFETFEMNEAEMKELETAGPKAWVISKKEFEEKRAKKVSDKKEL